MVKFVFYKVGDSIRQHLESHGISGGRKSTDEPFLNFQKSRCIVKETTERMWMSQIRTAS